EDVVSQVVFDQLQEAGRARQFPDVWKKLQAAARDVRRSGLARSIEEYAPGVATVAAPLFDGEDHLVAVLAVMGRTGDVDLNANSDICRALSAVSQRYRSKRAGNGGRIRVESSRVGKPRPAGFAARS